MALLTYDELATEVSMDVPACPAGMIVRALKQAAREFCTLSEAWRVALPPVLVEDYREAYPLAYLDETEIVRVIRVLVNDELLVARFWRFAEADKALELAPEVTPYSLTARMLRCGAAGETTAAGWSAVSDGAVTVRCGGTAYALSDLDFSAVTTMVEVAQVLQTAWRQAMARADVWVEYGSGRFAFIGPAAMGVLEAASEGTDIGGSSYLNGQSGTTGGWLAIEAVVRPHLDAAGVDSVLLETWGETIAARARASLLLMPGKRWTNAELGQYHQGRFHEGVTRAKAAWWPKAVHA